MKYITLFIISIFYLKGEAQSQVLPLKYWSKGEIDVYYKDLENELDDFVGTWLYISDNTPLNSNVSLKIILKKEEMYYNGNYYRDLIVGEYQYIEDGVEKVNTLNNINLVENINHAVWGSIIRKDCNFLPASDCIEGETRLDLSLYDRLTGHPSDAIFHKRIINGQQALRANIVFNYYGLEKPAPNPNMPWQGEYLLIKQD